MKKNVKLLIVFILTFTTIITLAHRYWIHIYVQNSTETLFAQIFTLPYLCLILHQWCSDRKEFIQLIADVIIHIWLLRVLAKVFQFVRKSYRFDFELFGFSWWPSIGRRITSLIRRSDAAEGKMLSTECNGDQFYEYMW